MNEAGNPAEPPADSLAVENAIFETAIEIAEPGQRREFLDRVFRDDPEGRAEMEELIDMAGVSSAFFLEGRLRTAALAKQLIDEIPAEERQPETPPPADGEREGATIDRYKLLRKIGEGGCGEVFEAARDGMIRTVALKVIRQGMDTDAVVSRFEAERHALELMEHPNIARVQDAGKTPQGRPYFVMELVRGPRITSFCETERLGIRERLELFLLVCQAIQHAHQKGIVHRDIKPSNILVESLDGILVPKVIDFGIAKAMQKRPHGGEGLTRLDQFVGTPAYMSPEQIDMGGMDIDTRADIYSLGALLYELLAGCPPFDTDRLLEGGFREMRRTLLEDDPPPPSEAARARGTTGEGNPFPLQEDKWAAALRGDLDRITGMAMEKERHQRYLTVNSLTMDIRRYLATEPVSARKPSRPYVLGKFCQRNRVACLLGAAVLLSLVGGLGTATVLYVREREALAEQERLKQQAQARANVSRAAILLSEGETEQADRLLRDDPLESIYASPEATEVFRSLGRWNAVFGRWRKAANCFALMNEANRLGDPAHVLEGVDLLMTAPAYLEAGDREAYLRFRENVLDRHAPAENSLQAEHLLKACLLLPADERILRRLESSAEVCGRRVPTESGIYLPDWNELSLTFFHYRRGDYDEAVARAEACLAYDDPAGSREAAANCLLAMARFHQGDEEDARRRLDEARDGLQRVESQADESGFPPIGKWFAWSVARILIDEAETTTGL